MRHATHAHRMLLLHLLVQGGREGGREGGMSKQNIQLILPPGGKGGREGLGE